MQQLVRLETKVDDLIGDMCPYSSLPNFLYSFYHKVTHDYKDVHLSRVSLENRLKEALVTIDRHTKEICSMKDKIYIDSDKATVKQN